MKSHFFFLCLFIIGCTAKTPAPPPQTTTTPVKITPVKAQQIRTIVYTTGKTITRQKTQLSFKVDGLIKHIAVQEGDNVKAQDTLAVLDQTEIRAHYAQAMAAYHKAYQDHQKAQSLQKDQVVTQTQLLGAQVTLEAARSARDIATYNLAHTVLIAPTNGRILQKWGEAEEMIRAGMPLFSFASETDIAILQAGITDRNVLHLAPGDSATVAFDAHPNTQIPATVEKIAAMATLQTGLYEIELAFVTPHTLLPGMIGHAHLYTQHSQNRWIIPIESLIDADNDRGFVYVFKDNIVYRRAVTLDKLQNNMVLIKDGLELGEHVVTDGASYLSDQSRVTLTK
jgi:RND family efflux transporter MFP subunit